MIGYKNDLYPIILINIEITIMNYVNHIRFLESKIYQLIYKNPKNNLTLPTCFEYYSAIFLTNLYNTPFNVWKDIDTNNKKMRGFPTRDLGIDLSNHTFSIVGQSKYYTKSTITYGKLSTFLAIEKLAYSNCSNEKFTSVLIRNKDSKIDSNVKKMIQNNIIIDIEINDKDFFNKIENLKDYK
jgi:hypothetical protein